MKNSAASLLETDHEALGQLLHELDQQLTKRNIASAYELLDRFWARLAVHIRAENLHLFPLLAAIAASSFAENSSLPTLNEAQDLLVRLRSDHDFFMKELAGAIKIMRELVATPPRGNEVEELRQRILKVSDRLEVHNHLEEEEAYTWPGLVFDEETIAALRARLQHELENLPSRFA